MDGWRHAIDMDSPGATPGCYFAIPNANNVTFDHIELLFNLTENHYSHYI